MRRTSAAALAGLASLALALPACDRSATALVVAVGSDAAPADLDEIELRVARGGQDKLARTYAVPAAASLPGTITIADEDGEDVEQPVMVSVRARRHEQADWRVTRTARLGMVEGKTKLLRLVLQRSCFDKRCDEGSTCIDGACRSDAVDPASLPDFVDQSGAVAGLEGGAGQAGAAGQAGGSGSGGAAGQGGSSGMAGASGSGGAGGQAAGGASGTGGASGAAGTGGSGGASGAGGSAGSGGGAGSGGSPLGQPTIDVAYWLSCAVGSDGAAYCWGTGGSAGPGLRVFPVEAAPVLTVRNPTKVAGTSGLESISIGDEHVCGLSSGSAICWGKNGVGQLGRPASDAENPGAAQALPAAVQVRAGAGVTCALTAPGDVYCFGAGFGDQPAKLSLADADPVVALAGHDLLCALHQSGAVRCWGKGLPGPTAVDGVSDAVEIAPWTIRRASGGLLRLDVSGATVTTKPIDGAPADVVQIAAAEVTCVRTASGSVLCNRSGTFVPVGNLPSDVVTIVAGGSPSEFVSMAACARRASGQILCWGDDDGAQVGIGKSEDAPSPVAVPSLSGVTAIAASRSRGAALTPGGLVLWGGPAQYQGLDYLKAPTPVPGLAGTFTRVRLGGYGGTRAALLQTDGTLTRLNDLQIITDDGGGLLDQPPPFLDAWPTSRSIIALRSTEVVGASQQATADSYPEFGNALASVGPYATATAALPAGETAVELVSGDSRACARMASGKLFCWGQNDKGQLGPGPANLDAPTEIALPTGTMVKSACLGERHSCLALDDGSVRCRGSNDAGLLGDEGLSDSVDLVTVAVGFSADGVACSAQYSCAWKDGGGAACWGDNGLSRLGIGSLEEKVFAPAPLALDDVVGLALGHEFGCARHGSGAVSCWGTNYAGQLGNGKGGYFDDAQAVAGVP